MESLILEKNNSCVSPSLGCLELFGGNHLKPPTHPPTHGATNQKQQLSTLCYFVLKPYSSPFKFCCCLIYSAVQTEKNKTLKMSTIFKYITSWQYQSPLGHLVSTYWPFMAVNSAVRWLTFVGNCGVWFLNCDFKTWIISFTSLSFWWLYHGKAVTTHGI